MGATGGLAALVDLEGGSTLGYTALNLRVPWSRTFQMLWPGVGLFLEGHAALLVLAFGGLFSLRACSPARRALLVGWLVAALLGYAAQMKAFLYHSLPLLAPLSLLAALALARVARWPRWIAATALCVLALTQLVPAERLWSGWGDLLRVVATSTTAPELWRERQPRKVWPWWALGQRIGRETREGDTLLVWGYEPLVHVAAQRRAPTRFVTNTALLLRWSEPQLRDELMADLRREPPSHIVVAHADVVPWATGLYRDSASMLRDFEALRLMLQNEYALASRTPLFSLYRRLPQPAGGSTPPAARRSAPAGGIEQRVVAPDLERGDGREALWVEEGT
jgi:hypothetical protein